LSGKAGCWNGVIFLNLQKILEICKIRGYEIQKNNVSLVRCEWQHGDGGMRHAVYGVPQAA
jgi:tRNA1(Val) A37 N6-methylase TrmN6